MGYFIFFGQNVAVDGGQRFAWHWLGTDNPVVYRFGFTLFHGEYRVKQFGYSSAITNVTLVVATAVTGYLAEVNWHLPFVVYLLPLVSLLLVGYLKEIPVSRRKQKIRLPLFRRNPSVRFPVNTASMSAICYS